MPEVTTSQAGKFAVRLHGTMTNLVLVGLISYFKGHNSLRGIAIGISVICLVFGSGGYLVGDYGVGRVSAPLLATGAGLLMAAVLSAKQFEISIGDAPAEEMQRAAVEERKAAEENVKHSPSPYASLELETARINEYYTINQAQARGSFRWAVFAMFCGLSTIVAGIWIFYLRQDKPDTFLTSLSTAAGIVVNTISGLYIYLHNRTQKRSLFYYGQLGRLQVIGIAIRVAETHDDLNAKKAARDKIIEQLLDLVKVSAEKDAELSLNDKD